MSVRRIAVIGNIGAGKTVLSRRLAVLHGIPCTHIDSIQYLPDLSVRPLAETRTALLEIEAAASWIIDGYGPLDLLEPRLAKADRVVFVDFPLWRHLWWLTKRQLKSLWYRRQELPPGATELGWTHTRKLYRTLLGMDRRMNPELRRILARPENAVKTVHVRSLAQWWQCHSEGLTAIERSIR